MSRMDVFLTVAKAAADVYIAEGKAAVEQYVKALTFLYANATQLTNFIETTDGLPPNGTSRLEQSVVDYMKYSFEGGPKPFLLTFNGF